MQVQRGELPLRISRSGVCPDNTWTEKAGIHRTHVGLPERGRRAAGLDIAKRIAAALEVPLAKLIAEAEREYEHLRSPPSHRDSMLYILSAHHTCLSRRLLWASPLSQPSDGLP
jgi:transcriptional regulator with XRE-family HTH domain